MQVERFSELRQALETLFQRIQTGEDITESLEQIDLLSENLDPAETPNMLRHYLERRSYTKALEFLKE